MNGWAVLLRSSPQGSRTTDKIRSGNSAIFKSKDPPFSVSPHEGFSFFVGNNYLNIGSMRGVIWKYNRGNLVFHEEKECI